MYCDKCGAENAPDAAFCRNCGREFPEVETRVSVRTDDKPYRPPLASGTDAAPAAVVKNDDDEPVIFSISPTLMFVKAGYVGAAIGALLLAAIFGGFFSSPWFGVGIGLLLFIFPAYFHLRRRLVRYTLTDTKVEIDSGFVARTTRNIPLRRIQDVTVSATILQRMLGFGDLVIDNASDVGGTVTLDDIDHPQEYADKLLKQMRRLDTGEHF